MRGKIIFFFFSILLLVPGMPEVGMGDGGGFWSECCRNLPEASPSDPVILGTFSAFRNKDNVPVRDNEYYKLEVTLNFKGAERFLTLLSPLETKRLCDYTDDKFQEKFRGAACGLKIEEAFGLVGTSVLRSVLVTERSLCNTPDEIIKGKIDIRVVPVR